MKRMKILAYPYSVWMAIFIVVPILLVLLYSFTEGDIRNLAELRFSTRSYERVLEPIYLKVIVNSFILATLSTLFCLLLGYPVAMIVARSNPKVRGMLLMFLIVPMWMNFLLRTYAWMSILSPNGFLNRLMDLLGLPRLEIMPGKTAVLLGMIYNFLPFMILPIYTVLSKIDKQYLEAANDLGANNARTFFKIILPLSIPGWCRALPWCFCRPSAPSSSPGSLGEARRPLSEI